MENNEILFLKNGGEMGSLILNYDWSQSPLGPLHSWSVDLKTNLSNILHAGFPMFLLWGTDRVFFL